MLTAVFIATETKQPHLIFILADDLASIISFKDLRSKCLSFFCRLWSDLFSKILSYFVRYHNCFLYTLFLSYVNIVSIRDIPSSILPQKKIMLTLLVRTTETVGNGYRGYRERLITSGLNLKRPLWVAVGGGGGGGWKILKYIL